LQAWGCVFVVMLALPGTSAPSFVAQRGGHVLAFDPKLEAIDFKNVPMFLDGRIRDAVRDGLAAQKSKLTWDFEDHLSIVRPLPDRISPAGEVKLALTGGKVDVTATELKLTLELGFRVRRDAPPASLRAIELDGAPTSSRHASAR
jgi:hypothetical protein